MERKEKTYLQHYLSMAKEREYLEHQDKPLKKVRKLIQGEKIELYDKVKLLNLTDHLMLDVMIVPDQEATLFEGKYGKSSSFGHAVLGREISTSFNFEETTYKIVSASRNRT